jgi:hypothetical protein
MNCYEEACISIGLTLPKTYFNLLPGRAKTQFSPFENEKGVFQTSMLSDYGRASWKRLQVRKFKNVAAKQAAFDQFYATWTPNRYLCSRIGWSGFASTLTRGVLGFNGGLFVSFRLSCRQWPDFVFYSPLQLNCVQFVFQKKKTSMLSFLLWKAFKDCLHLYWLQWPL